MRTRFFAPLLGAIGIIGLAGAAQAQMVTRTVTTTVTDYDEPVYAAPVYAAPVYVAPAPIYYGPRYYGPNARYYAPRRIVHEPALFNFNIGGLGFYDGYGRRGYDHDWHERDRRDHDRR